LDPLHRNFYIAIQLFKSPKKPSRTFQIVRLKASPAAFVGLVDARDEVAAIRVAVQQFRIRPVDQKRLLALPHG
jgi:hypothetical protein